MKIIGKKLTIDEFKKYVKDKDFGSIPPSKIVLHHTWKPTKDSWDGEKTIRELKSYYEGKGWSAAPHLFVAEDGIWLFTDMYDVGIHAGEGNAEWQKKSTGYTYRGWGDNFEDYDLLWYSIGIEVVGNYDNKVWSGKTYENAVAVIKILIDELDIKEKDLKFHRDYSNKTCPGKAITKKWVKEQLEEKPESKGIDLRRLEKSTSMSLGGKEGRINQNEANDLADYIEDLQNKNKDLKRVKKEMSELCKQNKQKADKAEEKNGRMLKSISTYEETVDSLEEEIEKLRSKLQKRQNTVAKFLKKIFGIK